MTNKRLKLFRALLSTDFNFEGKEDDEEVIVLLYRHWIILLMKATGFFALIILPYLVSILFGSFIDKYGLKSLYWFLTSAYVLLWWHLFFNAVTMYLLDIWIVTDKRVVDNEQYGFFNRSSAELNLARVQDVTVRVKGIIPTFFDYGDVEIQTAGTERNFTFKQVAHPYKVKDIIMSSSKKIARL